MARLRAANTGDDAEQVSGIAGLRVDGGRPPQPGKDDELVDDVSRADEVVSPAVVAPFTAEQAEETWEMAGEGLLGVLALTGPVPEGPFFTPRELRVLGKVSERVAARHPRLAAVAEKSDAIVLPYVVGKATLRNVGRVRAHRQLLAEQEPDVDARRETNFRRVDEPPEPTS